MLKSLRENSIRFSYAPILAVAMGVMLMRTLLVARILDLPEFGLFSIGMLISNSFCMVGCLGFYLILQRDLPMLLAKNRCIRANIALHQAIALALIIFIILLPVAFVEFGNVTASFLMVSIFNGLSQQIFLVVTLKSRSEGRSMKFAVDNLMRSIGVILVVLVGGSIARTAISMLLLEALVTIAMAVWLYKSIIKDEVISAKIQCLATIRSLINIKWSDPIILMATSALSFVLINGDRWLAATLLSRDAFAIYTFAGIILIVAQSAQSLINVSVFPALAKSYSINGAEYAAKKVVKLSLRVLLFLLICIFPAKFLAEYVINLAYPQYGRVNEFAILFFYVAALRLSDFFSSYLIIAGCEKYLFIVNSVSVAALVVGSYFSNAISNESLDSIDIAWLVLFIALLNYIACFVYIVKFIKRKKMLS